MTPRRSLLTRSAELAGMLLTLGLLPARSLALSPPNTASATPHNTAAFDAKNLPDVLRAFGAGAPVESSAVRLTAPDIAENGAVVPIGLACELAGVQRLLLLVAKNPSMLCAAFDVSDAVEANFATRIKMSESSPVYAVALMADHRVLYAVRDVQVTLGGCGD